MGLGKSLLRSATLSVALSVAVASVPAIAQAALDGACSQASPAPGSLPAVAMDIHGAANVAAAPAQGDVASHHGGGFWSHALSFTKGFAEGLAVGIVAGAAITAIVASAPVWVSAAVIVGVTGLAAYGIYNTVHNWSSYTDDQKWEIGGNFVGGIVGGGVGGRAVAGVLAADEAGGAAGGVVPKGGEPAPVEPAPADPAPVAPKVGPGNWPAPGTPLDPALLSRGPIDVVSNGGETMQVTIPDDYVPRVADNGKGVVWQKPGATGNADMIRVGDPTAQYPDGYVRVYNDQGQPLNVAGKPGSKADSHFHIAP